VPAYITGMRLWGPYGVTTGASRLRLLFPSNSRRCLRGLIDHW